MIFWISQCDFKDTYHAETVLELTQVKSKIKSTVLYGVKSKPRVNYKRLGKENCIEIVVVEILRISA